MIGDFYTSTFTVERQEWESGLGGSTATSVATFKGHIQQASPYMTQQLGLSMTKTFTVWCSSGADVVDGDLISDGTKEYTVRGVQENVVGDNRHKELVVELVD